MIVVKHVDSIFGSLLPIRLSTVKLVVLVIRLIVIFSFGFSQTMEKDRPEYCRHIFQHNSMKIVPRTRDIYNTAAMQSACHNISSCIFCKPVIF